MKDLVPMTNSNFEPTDEEAAPAPNKPLVVPPPLLSPPSPQSAAPQPTLGPFGGWHADPFERHQHRYWNGKKWTATVSDAGVPFTDPFGIKPTPLPPPGGNNAADAGWYNDPSGRHQFRYWAGRKWTARAADNGIEASDPPTLKKT